MWGTTKTPNEISAQVVYGWSEADLSQIEGMLTGISAKIQVDLTGFRQGLTIEAGCQRVDDRETKLVGALFGRIRIEGSISAVRGDWWRDGSIGGLTLSCLHRMTAEVQVPVLRFHLALDCPDDVSRLKDALRGSIGRGGAYANLEVERSADVAGWLADFRRDGHTSNLPIRKFYLGTFIGEAP